MSDETTDELARRVAELESELARVRAERDKYRDTACDLADLLDPPDPNWTPPAPEDTVDARVVLRELQRKFAPRSA